MPVNFKDLCLGLYHLIHIMSTKIYELAVNLFIFIYMEPTTTESYIKELLGNNSWLLLVGIIGLIFKSTIQKIVCGLFVFYGNDYNEDDIVYVNGKPGRIVRVGVWKTTFFIYEISPTGVILNGKKLVVQNERLASMNIEKPLPMLDIKSIVNSGD